MTDEGASGSLADPDVNLLAGISSAMVDEYVDPAGEISASMANAVRGCVGGRIGPAPMTARSSRPG